MKGKGEDKENDNETKISTKASKAAKAAKDIADKEAAKEAARKAVLSRGSRKKKEDTTNKLVRQDKQTKKFGKHHYSITKEPLVNIDMNNLVPAGNLFTY